MWHAKKYVKYVGMACQKVCKQGRNDNIIKVKVIIQSPILFILECNCSVKRCRDKALYILYHPGPTLFAYFLTCHPYIFYSVRQIDLAGELRVGKMGQIQGMNTSKLLSSL